ncbi:MAG: hypothetical protein IPO18_07710 [bacterium]|jgi:hypothetical protein|nr:hypothetical protein [bacterium]MBK7771445.1 hypothetical protein [bacterium]MBK9472158.1 hypothetical protein [bacterium]
MKKIQLRRSFAGALVALLLLAGVAAAQPSMVSYQGQLNVSGVPFTGNANFKFAIMCGTTSPWSNDGTSSNGSQPSGFVTLPVAQGVFSVLLGDPALSMIDLTANLIESCSSPDLRVWVDTGTGFEQLTDQPLASSPFALKSTYADGALGTFKVSNSSSTLFSVNGTTGQADVGSIRFPDNTVQTTAAVGSGPDGDWTIVGSNVHTAVSGNVGIGTVSPASKLHVLGSVRSDGTGGFDARNPNNTAAISRFDWNADIARIRVGGTGTGALNGFDIEGISDASWLRILNNGNVGINTTTPAERLVVNGNTVVTGNLTVQGTLSGGGIGGGTAYLSLGPPAFLEEQANLTDLNRTSFVHGRTVGQRLNLHSNLNLPHGATITRCEVFCHDAEPTQSNGENIVFTLMREPLTGGTGTILATAGTQNAPGEATLDSGALSVVANNQDFYYDLIVFWDTPAPPRAITDMRVYGARITYTLP